MAFLFLQLHRKEHAIRLRPGEKLYEELLVKTEELDKQQLKFQAYARNQLHHIHSDILLQ